MLKRMLAEHLPDYHVTSVTLAGEGVDHTAFEVNGELIVRFTKEPEPIHVQREARLLEVVNEISAVPVPRPLFVSLQPSCLAYRKIPGVQLLDVPLEQRLVHFEAIAAGIGQLLTALHAAPTAQLTPLVETDTRPPREWLDEARDNYAAVAVLVPVGLKKAIEAFLAAPPPPGTAALVFSHNDLGLEHILVDAATWRLTGIIDWSDAAIVDPACDLGRLCRDLGPAGLDAIFGHYQGGCDVGAALRDRVTFYARCLVFEDMLFGVETSNSKYVEKSLPALDWLFS